MRNAIKLCLLLFCLFAPSSARADSFVISTAVVTAGTFNCLSSIVCSGEGTNSITFGSGDNTATLSFTGVNTTFDVTNTASPVTLGEFELTASDGFTFPIFPTNPKLPILQFLMRIDQATPVAAVNRKMWRFGPGGRPDLTLQMGPSYALLPVGPDALGYDFIVYTLNPFPFTLEPNTTTSMTAQASLVPEPATMVLLGTGLVGAAMARRRRQRAHVQEGVEGAVWSQA